MDYAIALDHIVALVLPSLEEARALYRMIKLSIHYKVYLALGPCFSARRLVAKSQRENREPADVMAFLYACLLLHMVHCGSASG